MVHPALYPTEEHHAFYYFLGVAVSQWAHVKHGLSLVAWRCSGSPDETPLMTSFYAIENFRSKLGFVDSAFKLAPFAKKFAAEWTEIRESARALADQRNRMTHRQLMIYPHAKEGGVMPSFPPQGSELDTAKVVRCRQAARSSLQMSKSSCKAIFDGFGKASKPVFPTWRGNRPARNTRSARTATPNAG
jgi:ribosomal protein L37E